MSGLVGHCCADWLGSCIQQAWPLFSSRPTATGDGRNFASFANFFEVFAKFFEVLASFFKFSDVLGPAWTCSDTFGCIRMRLGAFGCVRTLSEKNRVFRANGLIFLFLVSLKGFLASISLYFRLNSLAKFIPSTVLMMCNFQDSVSFCQWTYQDLPKSHSYGLDNRRQCLRPY